MACRSSRTGLATEKEKEEGKKKGKERVERGGEREREDVVGITRY